MSFLGVCGVRNVASRRTPEAPIGRVATCAIDGGAPPKTAFATQHPGRLSFPHGSHWSVERVPPSEHAGPWDLIVGEKPEGVIRPGRNVWSVLSPAGWGMAGMFSVPLAPGGLRVWLPMKEWKQKLLGSAWNARKAAACANLVDMFHLVGLDPENDLDQDAIDAIAIGEAAQRFTRKELKKWHVEW